MSEVPATAVLRQLGLVFVTLGLITVIGAFYVIHAVLTFNPIQLPFAKQIRISLFIPQGWGFFTRDPREPRFTFFEKRNERWEPISNNVNAHWTNAFGWSRRSDAEDRKWYRIVEQANRKANWVSCEKKKNLESCLKKTQPIVVQNGKATSSWCGTLGVVSQKPVPWAWTQSGKAIHMPRQVITLRTLC
jgi:antimicrobial peptide system SdpA family protein